jgi:GWxTD domain-containing protein
MIRSAATAAMLLLLTLPAMPAPAVAATTTKAQLLDAPEPGWRHGPVRYLLTRQEAQVFKKLRTDEERAAFIQAFWGRRDPTPETRENEFRERFYERVEGAEALRIYFSSSKPMWLTDPGRIYVLLGPPTPKQHDVMASTERDTVHWSYDGVSGGSSGRLTFAFVANESGELRITDEPQLDRATIQGLASPPPASFFSSPAMRPLYAANTQAQKDPAADVISPAKTGKASRGPMLAPPSRSLIMGGTNQYHGAQRMPQSLATLVSILAAYANLGITGFRMGP